MVIIPYQWRQPPHRDSVASTFPAWTALFHALLPVSSRSSRSSEGAITWLAGWGFARSVADFLFQVVLAFPLPGSSCVSLLGVLTIFLVLLVF